MSIKSIQPTDQLVTPLAWQTWE